MKNILLHILLGTLLVSCQDFEPVPVQEFSAEQLVVEGQITDSLQTQRISVGLVSNLGDSAAVPIDPADLSLTIYQGATSYPFYAANGTTMLSTTDFKGIPDSSYQIDFCYKGTCYQKDFMMPSKPTITGFTALPEFSSPSNYAELHLELDCPVDQYLRYELYVNPSIQMPDTLWTKYERPIYWTQEVLAGTYSYHLNQYQQPQLYLGSYGAAKIIIFSLDVKAAEYFRALEDFMESNSVGTQYQNPPFFYDGEVYGLTYGTTVDSAIFVF